MEEESLFAIDENRYEATAFPRTEVTRFRSMDLGRLGGPLGSPDPHPWRGNVEQAWRECVEEDRSEAFDDVGFHAWCVDQA